MAKLFKCNSSFCDVSKKDSAFDLSSEIEKLQLTTVTRALEISLNHNISSVTIGKFSNEYGRSSESFSNSVDVSESINTQYISTEDSNYQKEMDEKIWSNSVEGDMNQLVLKKQLCNLEIECRSQVKKEVAKRIHLMEETFLMQRYRILIENENRHLDEAARLWHEEQEIIQQLRNEEIEADLKRKQIEQEQKKHAEEYFERKKEAELKLKEQYEKEKQRMKEIKKNLDKLHNCQIEYRKKYQQILETLQLRSDKQSTSFILSVYSPKLKAMNESMEQIVKKSKGGEVEPECIIEAEEFVKQIEDILFNIQKEIDRINLEPEESQSEKIEPSEKVESESEKPKHDESELSEKDTKDLNSFVVKEAFKMYIDLQENLLSVQDSYKELVSDEKFKKLKFNLQKAVNIPVNAISPINGRHLFDKYDRLTKLLSGQRVEAGTVYVSAADHPQGIPFCKALLAKKFVSQGEQTVSSKPEAAFPMAAVICALWTDHPDFGKLVIAYFHKECPYLVPMFMPQLKDQSTEDYYRSLGYHYSETNEVEKQDKFLKRMSGIMHLYSAIMVAKQRMGNNKPHPHGLENGWRWLSCLLNLEPHPDICATMLFVFLEVTGNAMLSAYGQQFQKLLHLICKEYFPKLMKISESSSGGPISRLEQLLQEIVRTSKISPPEGALPQNFW